ncbi:threonine/serine exporter [Paenibacillus chitinolyticus]|uniref:Threonine/serine exporter n=1 Tax=Paenibacillus chitinolyticus TaxID=79263 RepID=A0A410WPQ1_9BACL|nr:threonine/serine exporter family protein [Paenibacillus chitinolyticus]MCY9590841.1 threonine/serine exporter family protein [Paenibacillus chitinolyticus]MCY9598748.1 threonine/serine exporter family protein [Paenibacillus chitinolyticus]QAV16287.1 threonine/serine exporter [Paenibacillus chitinolyticus]
MEQASGPGQTYKIVDVCLLAGKIMLQNGGETYRVEDTMTRIAASYGLHHTHSFVTPTGIIFSVDGSDPTKLVRISTRSTDLHKVTLVNGLSRKISNGELDLQEAHRLLLKVDRANLAYPVAIQIAAAAVSSGCFTIMFNGGWPDFLPAVVTGGLGFIGFLIFHRYVLIKFVAEFLASFIIGMLASLFIWTGLGQELDKIIIGSVMPLVPGLLITNAVRDLMAGHLVSGLSKGAEAFLTAFAIGAGIAVVFSFY